MYKVVIYKKAVKSLQKLPRDYQTRIHKVVQKLKENPFALDLKKLHQPQETSHRLRMGNYRLFLDIDTSSKQIIIVAIERRTSQTY